jgi:hypothetical protein
MFMHRQRWRECSLLPLSGRLGLVMLAVRISAVASGEPGAGPPTVCNVLVVVLVDRPRLPGASPGRHDRQVTDGLAGEAVQDSLTLEVPQVLGATYLVPGGLSAGDAEDRIVAGLGRHVTERLAGALAAMVRSRLVTIAGVASSSLPALDTRFQEYLGASPDQVRAVTRAESMVAIRAVADPASAPLHEWCARAAAAVLAAGLGVPVVDAFVPRVLEPGVALSALPGADMKWRLADWVVVFQSTGELGVRATTKGLGRWGLPELQARNVSPEFARPWVAALTGIAGRLVSVWHQALRPDPRPAFARVPAELTVSSGDLARAYNGSAVPGRERSAGQPTAVVRLVADPAPDPARGSFLTVTPPAGYPASAGEHLAEVCATLFGAPPPQVRQVRQTEAMDQAIATARRTLPGIRERFLSGRLQPPAQLMVKHKLAVPGDHAGAGEYVWAYVTSWRDPARILGYSASDAITDEHVRRGRPAVIDVAAICDWAAWTPDEGITEGGWTNTVATAEDPPAM